MVMIEEGLDLSWKILEYMALLCLFLSLFCPLLLSLNFKKVNWEKAKCMNKWNFTEYPCVNEWLECWVTMLLDVCSFMCSLVHHLFVGNIYCVCARFLSAFLLSSHLRQLSDYPILTPASKHFRISFVLPRVLILVHLYSLLRLQFKFSFFRAVFADTSQIHCIPDESRTHRLEHLPVRSVPTDWFH